MYNVLFMIYAHICVHMHKLPSLMLSYFRHLYFGSWAVNHLIKLGGVFLYRPDIYFCLVIVH